MCARGDEVREFIRGDEIEFSKGDSGHAQVPGHQINAGLQGVIGRCLSKAAHRFLRGLVGEHGRGVVLHAFDAVGAHNGAHGFAQLQRRAARIGADVFECLDPHGANLATVLKPQRDIENAVGPLHITASHVLNAVFNEAHGAREFLGQIGHQDGVL